MNLSLAYQSQLYLGLFERETYSWLKRLSRGIATAIDIGAADGEYRLFFLKRTTAKKVFAFEPDRAKVCRLKDNVRLNGGPGPSQLMVIDKFIGNRRSDNTISLDSGFENIEVPCLIKIDVDGAEADILAGAQWLKSMKGTRWLIETHSRELERTCVQSLRDAGFQVKIIRNAWWRVLIPEQRPIPHNPWLAAWKKLN
jgi:hypothetical protein